MSLQNNIDFEKLLAQIIEEANKLQTSSRQDPAPPTDAIAAAAVAAGILRPPPPPPSPSVAPSAGPSAAPFAAPLPTAAPLPPSILPPFGKRKLSDENEVSKKKKVDGGKNIDALKHFYDTTMDDLEQSLNKNHDPFKNIFDTSMEVMDASHSKPIDVSDEDEPEPKKEEEWAQKPIILQAHSYDLTPRCMKQIIIGNQWCYGVPVRIVLGKLDYPNNFIVMSSEEWDIFESYFDIFADFLSNRMIPLKTKRRMSIGELTVRITKLQKTPTVYIENNAGGKFYMQLPVFNRLRMCVPLVKASIADAQKTAVRIQELYAGDTTILPKDAHIKAEMEFYNNITNKTFL